MVKPDKVIETLSRHMLADGFELTLDLDRSQGSIIYDSWHQKEYVDFFSFFASCPVGVNHPKMNNPKTWEYFGKLAINNPTNSDIYTTQMADFVETFARVAGSPKHPWYFWIAGGGLAIENALKAAFDWKFQKNEKVGKHVDENELKVIHFRDAFHGRTGYTLSLTNTDPIKYKWFPKFDWPRIINPEIAFPMTGANLDNVIKAETEAVNQIKQAIKDNPNKIAALLIEPIQAEGGDKHFRNEFFKALRQICDENEIIFIYDEVQTGVGLTGKMWAWQHFDAAPDIYAFGKKTQVCGIASSNRINDIESVFKVSSRINSTWGGNLIDMVRFQYYLEIIEEEKLVDNAAKMGKYLLQQLEELQTQYPNILSNARGRGMMCAIDMPDAETRNKLKGKIYDNGVIVLGCGTKTIRFRPNLNVTKEILDRGFEGIRKALKSM